MSKKYSDIKYEDIPVFEGTVIYDTTMTEKESELHDLAVMIDGKQITEQLKEKD